MSYTRIIDELAGLHAARPGLLGRSACLDPETGELSAATRTASPAGDALPVLAAYDAEVVLVRSGGGTRTVAWNDFTGVKQTSREPGELILGARWAPPCGLGSFSKIGTRNAMVIAVASLPSARPGRSVGPWRQSVAPTVVRATEVECVLAAAALDEAAAWDDPTACSARPRSSGSASLSPGRGVRSTTCGDRAYRRHACAVLASPALAGARGPAGRLMLVRANVNGEWREADVWPGSSSLSLREHLALPGSKNVCEQGECGSCSVWLDDELVCACLVLVAQAEGREVRTVGPRRWRGDAPGAGGVRRVRGSSGSARWAWLAAVTDLPSARRPRRTPRSARPCRATSAAAPATRRSSRPCGSRSTA